MLSVWQRTTINSERYCALLDKVAENLKGKHVNVYHLYDNARSHIASMTCKKIKDGFLQPILHTHRTFLHLTTTYSDRYRLTLAENLLMTEIKTTALDRFFDSHEF